MAKKAQAALEFLSTYGFAFLIILVMIGALAYFGVLNPSRFLPERCIFGQEFECRESQLVLPVAAPGTVEVYFVLSNNLGESIELNQSHTGASIAVGPTIDRGTCVLWDASAPGPVGANRTIPSGGTQEIQCVIASPAIPADGDKLKVQIDMEYRPVSGRYIRPIKGEIFNTLQSR